MEYSLEPLVPFGALITNFDFDRDFDAARIAEMQGLLRKHLVLVFRGHARIEDLRLIEFAAGFGELIKGSEWLVGMSAHPEILPVSNIKDDDGLPIGTGGVAALGWHADYSYTDKPAKESFLDAETLPANPPTTSFVDQYAALAALPADFARRLEGLSAYHAIGPQYFDKSDPTKNGLAGHEEAVERDREKGIERPRIPDAIQPAIVAHPETGRQALYLSEVISKYMIDVPAEESDEILQTALRHLDDPKNIYEHHWQEGDLVVFDAIGTLHSRQAFDPDQPRYMRQLSTISSLY